MTSKLVHLADSAILYLLNKCDFETVPEKLLVDLKVKLDSHFNLLTTRLQYKMIGSTGYHKDTPDEVIELLEKLHFTGERVKITYGNTANGIAWEDSKYERGKISRSTGKIKIPLLIRTKRSLGGEAIFTNCIIRVQTSKGNKTVYELKLENSHPGTIDTCSTCVSPESTKTDHS